MEKKYNWAILSAARIANKFADGLKELPDANRYAVAARSLERAEVFKETHGFEKAYGSYEEMLADPNVDVVYVATTNNLHFKHTMMCLEAGKAVLCEKPFASDLEQVKQMIAKAKEKKVFLMEALWSRFLPDMMQFKTEVANGIIGKPSLFQCNHGFVAPFNPSHRAYNPELGGGSIPDIGIYAIFMPLYLFGKPESIQVTAVPAPTGTDWTTAILFKHKGGEISVLTSSFQLNLSNDAILHGDGGQLKLHAMFHCPTKLTFQKNNGREVEKEVEIPIQSVGNGYNYEAAEVMACLEKGVLESPNMSWQFSLDLMDILDEVVRKAEESY
ncbi:MAG: Gfo/Idh/MocA family oxidoreductase [Candidatus Symbiothrix sp.]|jgi:predicted dehydrogenase|nr:Gfo/Idh/MocA family oxidoreductase [Candidatus Symbiothrix sp.]